MSIIARTIRVIRAKFNKLLSTQEDPLEQLEMQYEDMRSQRRDLKQNIVNVKAQRKSLERKLERFREEIEDHNEQARQAMEQGEEDLARAAIEQKKVKEDAVTDLSSNVEEIENVEDGLYDKLDTIDERIDELKMKKEVLSARYEGAEAMSNVNESIAGDIGEYSVEENVEDIKTEINEMQSRAEAVQEFEEETDEQTVEEKLQSMNTDSQVENELDTLREEVGGPTEAEPEVETA